MILRIIVTFCLFAGLAYYFDIDVRKVVEESGAPTWLAGHGINIAPNESREVGTSSEPIK